MHIFKDSIYSKGECYSRALQAGDMATIPGENGFETNYLANEQGRFVHLPLAWDFVRRWSFGASEGPIFGGADCGVRRNMCWGREPRRRGVTS